MLGIVLTVLNAGWGILFIFIGVEMANNPPGDNPRRKTKYRILSALLGVLVIVTTVIQGLDAKKQQDAAAAIHKDEQKILKDKLGSTQDKLDVSLLNEGEMKGKLKLISDTMSKAHCPAVAEIASALKSELDDSKIKENQPLIERVHVISARLNRAWQDHEHKWITIHAKRHVETQEQKEQVAREDAEARLDYESALSPIVDEAKFVRAQILQKLAMTTDEDKKWDGLFADQSFANIADSGLGGYMERLGQRLSLEK